MLRSNLLPRSLVGKILATVWLALCFSVLAFGYVQRAVHDMPEAFILFMVYLSFPIGAAIALTVATGLNWVYQLIGLPYVPFRDEVPFWLVAVLVGYWQWFRLLPWIAKKLLVGIGRNA